MVPHCDGRSAAVIVSPTPFISDHCHAQLKTFGGKVVLVGAEQSFLKNENGSGAFQCMELRSLGIASNDWKHRTAS
jgi:hypothetical protein